MPRTQTAAAAMPATNGQIQQPVRRRTRRRGRPAGSTSRSGAATGTGRMPNAPTGEIQGVAAGQHRVDIHGTANLSRLTWEQQYQFTNLCGLAGIALE